MKNKILVFVTLLSFIAIPAKSQSENLFFQALEGLNKVSETVTKLWSAFSKIDSTINKEKIKAMSAVLYSNISDIVVAKKDILNKIAKNSASDFNLSTEINKLISSTSNLKETLYKYDGLIKAIGMDAQSLAHGLRIDFANKMNTLKDVEQLLQGNTQPRQVLKSYFESSINILEGAMLKLEKFSSSLLRK